MVWMRNSTPMVIYHWQPTLSNTMTTVEEVVCLFDAIQISNGLVRIGIVYWHCSMHCIATYHLYLWHAIVMVTRVNRCARSAAISHDDDDDDDDDVDDDDNDDDD